MKPENAIFIPDLDRLPPPDESYTRLYLGSEFCHWRLPSAMELHQALDSAKARGMTFSLVTPFLDDAGLRRTMDLVRELPTDGATEVIANDFGLLETLAEAKWQGTVVAGRLLTRQRRGPGFQDPIGASPEALDALRGSALDSPPFVDFLRGCYGIQRFEIDDLAQGVDIGELPDGVRISLYRPFLFVTATRNCPWIFNGRAWDRTQGCARPCRGKAITLEPMPDAPSPWSRPLLLGGCAQFVRGGESPGYAGPALDRIVWQPDIPS